MSIGAVYKITNQTNGKFYIGLTTQNLNSRLNNHVYSALVRQKNNKLAKAIRLAVKQQFKIEKIAECNTKEELAKLEKKLIIKHSATKHGYNTKSGGVLGGNTGKSITVEGKYFESYVNLCRHYNVDYGLFCSRLRYGWSVLEALGQKTRLRKPRANTKIKFRGKSYSSMKALSEKFNVPVERVRHRIFKGWTIEEALELQSRKPKNPIKFKGKTYPNKAVLAKAFGVSKERLYARLKLGFSLEEALEIKPHSKPNYKSVKYKNRIFETKAALAKYYKVNYKTLYYLTNTKGLSIAEAMERLLCQ